MTTQNRTRSSKEKQQHDERDVYCREFSLHNRYMESMNQRQTVALHYVYGRWKREILAVSGQRSAVSSQQSVVSSLFKE